MTDDEKRIAANKALSALHTTVPRPSDAGLAKRVHQVQHEELPKVRERLSTLDDDMQTNITAVKLAIQSMHVSTHQAIAESHRVHATRLVGVETRLGDLADHAVHTHAYITRHGWLRHPIITLLATVAAATVGGYLAAMGAK